MSSFQPKFIEDVPAVARRWRRVVTGERNGRSTIVIDEAQCPYQMGIEGANGLAVTDMWRTGPNPRCAPAGPDSCSLPLVFGPNEGGTVVQILEWPPDRQLFGTADPAVAKAATSHQTATIDYVYVISGEIHVILDDGEVRLSAGDTLVQRGTSHAWSNRSNAPCRMFVVMLDATAA